MLHPMSDRPQPTESAPPSTQEAKGRPRGSKNRTMPPEAQTSASDAVPASASESEAVIARTRKILERLIRGAGYGWRDIDRMIHKNRGFTAHLLSKREGLPLNDVLAILDAIDVRHEDFFGVLFPKHDKPREKKPVGEGMFELLNDLSVPEAPEQSTAESDEHSREIWNRLGRISALIDQRVLALMESALSEPLQQPLRQAARPAEPAAEGAAATGGPGKAAGE